MNISSFVEMVKLVFMNFAYIILSSITHNTKHDRNTRTKEMGSIKDSVFSVTMWRYYNPFKKIENSIWACFEKKLLKLLLMQSMDLIRNDSNPFKVEF